MRTSLLRTLLFTPLLWIGPTVSPAPADEGGRELVYPADEKVEGRTREEWTVAWFQWAMSIKKDRNPVTDKTGEFAGEGQSGPVWFLAGNFGGVTRRSFPIPSGKPLFSPVFWWAGAARPGDQEKTLPATITKQMEGRKDLKVTLDGMDLGDLSTYRVPTKLFPFTGLHVADAVHPDFARKRVVCATGYWFMLKPLPPGKHTLRVKAKQVGPDEEVLFELDVTYDLQAVENKEP